MIYAFGKKRAIDGNIHAKNGEVENELKRSSTQSAEAFSVLRIIYLQIF